MGRTFPHLTPRGGDFPYIDRVDVYQYRNDFNYHRWAEASRLEIMNVPFPADFSEIVDWGTPAARDAELSALPHYTSEPLPSNFRLDKNGVIKVPIPFDAVDGANYLIVRNGQAATSGAVTYETATGIRDLFFFILDCEQLAPNTTRLTVKLDVWTTYFDRLEIEAGYVERGHAPMWHGASVDAYLASPLDHTDHLTAHDVEVSSSGEIVTYQRPTLLDDSVHYLCFESQYDVRALRDITAAAPVNHEITALGYAGNWDETVTGWNWNLGADSLYQPIGRRTVRDAQNRPPQALGRNSPNQPGGFVYGIEAEIAQEWFERLFSLYPHFAQNIQAVYLVPGKIINRVLEYTIPGVGRMFLFQPKKVVVNLELTRDKFAYPERYAGLTKLYTSPYATLVLSDALGHETEVRVQDTTSALAVNLYATLLSGCSLRAEFDGVGGASGTYRWWVVESHEEVTEQLTGHAGRFFQEKQLPVYRLALDAGTRHDLSVSKMLPIERQQAIINYGNGQRTAGTALDNALRTNATARANAQRSTNTALANAYRAARVGKENADEAANAAYETAMRTINAGRTADLAGIAANRAYLDLTNSTQRQSNAIEVDFLDADNQQQREKATFQFNINRQNRAANLAVNVDYQAQSLQNTLSANAAQFKVSQHMQKVDVATGMVDQTVGLVTSALTGDAAGLASGFTGLVTGSVRASESLKAAEQTFAIDRNRASAETTLSIFKDTELAEIETETDRAKINNAEGPHGIGGLATDYSFNEQIRRQRALTVDNMNRKTALDVDSRTQQTEIGNDLANSNSLLNVRTQTDNANTARALSRSVSQRSRQAAEANADASAATSNDNADATRATGDANARDAYNIGKYNAQTALPLVASRAKAAYDTAAMAPDTAITAVGGDGFIFETRRDGFTVQVRTPNADATAQLGDFFLRWGYAANRMYDMRRLSLYSKFTYWQASDVFIRPTANAHILGRVKEMFRAGVTVWRKMADIGTMCIYDNERED